MSIVDLYLRTSRGDSAFETSLLLYFCVEIRGRRGAGDGNQP